MRRDIIMQMQENPDGLEGHEERQRMSHNFRHYKKSRSGPGHKYINRYLSKAVPA